MGTLKNELEKKPEYVTQTLKDLTAITNNKPPIDAAELQKRCDDYFNYCQCYGMKPGIESLCLCLGVTRSTFYKWQQGSRGSDFMQISCMAKQIICAFIESAMYSGQINGVCCIFALKNIANWEDAKTTEVMHYKDSTGTVADLPIFNLTTAKEIDNNS